jgi:hypothetical protein
VFESNFSVMDGQTNYTYQPDSDPNLPRIIDTVTTDVFNNSTREEHQPNSRHQFDNIFSFGKSGLGGEHLLKAGVQWGRLYYASDYSVRLDHWLVYNNNVPTAVRIYNSPAFSKNVATVTGFFIQDAWSMNRLTLNLGARYDKYVGTLPDQSSPGGTFAAGRTVAENEAINQSIAVWRLGASYDLTGSGRTAIKSSYSRYGLQVGIDRVTNVNPLTVGSADCPWTDPNANRKYDVGEINLATCPAFSGGTLTNYAPGVDWPHSDEVTAGVETQLRGQVRINDPHRNQQLQDLRNAYNAHLLQSAGTILNPEQRSRYQQLDLQHRGFDAFADAELRRRLNLTEAHLQRVQALSQQNNQSDLARGALSGVMGCSPDWVGVADQANGFEWRSID